MTFKYNLGVVDYVVIITSLLISTIIGIRLRSFGGKQQTTKEYLMAGKNMSMFPVIMSIAATMISPMSMLGNPAETYRYGIQLCMMSFGIPFGMVLASYVIIPVYFQCGVSTSYEFLELRFGKSTRYLVSAMFILQMVLWMSSVLYSPVLALNAVTNISMEFAIVLFGAICAFYCTIGGLKAVLWTDVLQALLMIIAMMSLFVAGIKETGGVGNIIDRASEGERLTFNFQVNPIKRYTFWNGLLYGICYGFGAYGTSQIEIQRMLSLSNVKRAQATLLISMLPIVGIYLSLAVFGVVLYAIYYMCDPILNTMETGLTKYDQLVPYFLVSTFHSIPGMTGLCVAGIISGSLSTVSSALNSLATVTVMDFIRPLSSTIRQSETKSIFIAKVLSFSYGLVCIGVTFTLLNASSISQVGYLLNSSLEGPTTAVFAIGVLTRKGFGKSVLFGLLSGYAITCWIGYSSLLSGYHEAPLPLNNSMCPSSLNITYDFPVTSPTCLAVNNCSSAVTSYIDSNRDIFTMNKVSYLWIRPLGFIITVCCIFISIFVTGWKTDAIPLDSKCLSPVTRLWMKKTKECQKNIEEHNLLMSSLSVGNVVNKTDETA
ncbi:sodium-coupled monocarboxylate transporter 1 [Nephila pilipes]|uniref:Sodium-coupled monocarboxylate transporter 1 n=1 Tax=Nephila pilipes TaxID=299642 RepID=A0A8X6NHI8_NEPPI|nr:sodium-coupled monocarboxylate transporter 1 [Nephila pilipes]